MKRDYFMLFLAILFSSVLWTMTAFFGVGLVRQAGTANWPAADEATVLESRVTSHRGNKGGTTYKAAVKYRYRVGTNWQTGDRITFTGLLSESGSGYANRIVAQFPQGGPATVFVDPKDWATSVLFRGVPDHEWRTVAFMGTFAVIPFVLWGVFFGSVIRSGRGHVGTVRVFEPAPGVSVFRDIAFGLWAAGLAALVACAVATLILILTAVDSHNREALMICWSTGILIAAGAAAARWRWIKSGRKDAVIDLNAGTLSLARGWRREPEVIELAGIVETQLRQDSSSSTNRVRHWRVHLLTVESDKTRPVADIHRKKDAEAFEAWLRARLALPLDPKAEDAAL